MRRVVVSIDPSGSGDAEADECGIVACGIDEADHLWVLADATLRASPQQWAAMAIALFHNLAADRIIAEVNFGGGMVEATLRAVDPNIPFKAVHASRGKIARAEPVSALYEQRRVFHLGAFPELEDEMCAFTSAGFGGGSPNRVDALVWAITELAVAPMRSFGIFELYRQMAEAQTAREAVRIEAPDPLQRRQDAILIERQRFAALMADRPPTAEEAAEHVAAIDAILCGRHSYA